MSNSRSGPSGSAPDWQRRVVKATAVQEQWASQSWTREEEEKAHAWLAGLDRTAYVGARHHTVPRFLLERWADEDSQLRVYHRLENKHAVENINNLAIKDFYTFIDLDGAKNSSIESMFGVVEGSAKKHIDRILNPFQAAVPLSPDAIMSLNQFAAFQSTRTARHRREVQLHAEWYAKTLAAGRVPDAALREVAITPHQTRVSN